MVTKTIFFILFSSSFFFSGCDTTKVDSKDFNTLLKEEKFSEVIERLEPTASTDDEYLALGAAYMGLSSLKISDVINKICKSSETQEGSSLMAFTQSAKYDKAKCDVPLSYLNKATTYFLYVIGDKCSTEPESLSLFERDVCVYKGLSQTMEAVTTLNYIQEDNKLKASSCAMEYALKGTVSECSIFVKGDVQFVNNTKTYEAVYVYVDGSEYEYLLEKSQYGLKKLIITDGYCKIDDAENRTEDKDVASSSAYHVCPVNLNEAVSDTQEVIHPNVNQFIVDSFNKGTEAILIGSDDKLLTKTVDGFRQEIYATRENNEKHELIDEEDMLLYLKQQNR